MKSHEAWLCLLRPSITSLFLPPISFPTPQITLPLHSINIPKPYLQGGGIEICSLVCSLGCLINKSFLCCKPWHLGIWLAVHQAKEPGSVTIPSVLLLLCCSFLKLLWPSKWGFYPQKSGNCGPSTIYHIQWASSSSTIITRDWILQEEPVGVILWLSLENEWRSSWLGTGRKIWKSELPKQRAKGEAEVGQIKHQGRGPCGSLSQCLYTTGHHRGENCVSSTVSHLSNRCGIKAFCPQMLSKSWII